SVASGTRPTESATPRSSDDTRVEVQVSMSQTLPALANRLITRLALPVVLTLALNTAPAAATPVISAGNLPYSGISPGGVDMSTGELILVMRPDLAIDGPFPLVFRRYYASMLQREGFASSKLGPNWLHT